MTGKTLIQLRQLSKDFFLRSTRLLHRMLAVNRIGKRPTVVKPDSACLCSGREHRMADSGRDLCHTNCFCSTIAYPLNALKTRTLTVRPKYSLNLAQTKMALKRVKLYKDLRESAVLL